MDQLYTLRKLISISLLLIAFTALEAVAQSNFTVTPDPASGCGFLRVRFTNTTAGNITGELWDFGDGSTIVRGTVNNQQGPPLSANVERLYTSPGTYNVTLIAYVNGVAQPISATRTVQVNPLPSGSFRIAEILGNCAPVTVRFDASQVTGGNGVPITTYQWTFGDGRISQVANPTHTYLGAGSFRVNLTVTDANGCQRTFTLPEPVNIGEGFRLNMDAQENLVNRTTCQAPLEVNFTSNPGIGNFTYLWNFGDGNTSTLQNPSHTYTTFGNFNVNLTVRNLDNNCTVSEQLTNFVRIINFQPSFTTALQGNACAPAQVRFENTSSAVLEGQTVTWDFGDGTTLTGPANDPEFRTPIHTYTRPGNFTVRLAIGDATGKFCEGSIETPDAVVLPDAIVADFTADQTGFCTLNNGGFTVNFSDLSMGASSWLWDFGDGTTSTEQNPTHTYNGFGNYDVTLTVTNAQGCSNTLTRERFINARETQAFFGAFASGGCFPSFTTTLFDSTLTAVGITSREWEIRNDRTGQIVATATGQSPTIAVSDTGSFSVTLRITTAEGCDNEITRNGFLRVGVRPDLMAFEPSERLICNGTTVDFTNNSQLSADNPYETRWAWQYLPNSGLDSVFNGNFTYAGLDPNPVTVTLYAFNNGCTDTLVFENAIQIELPRAGFDAISVPCVVDSIFIVDTSLGAQRVEYEVSFNGEPSFVISDNRNPVVFVPPGASWTIIQRVFNDDSREGQGCDDELVREGREDDFGAPDFDLVTQRPFDMTDTDQCYPSSFIFDASQLSVPGSTIVSYFWDLGNGATARGVDPGVLYAAPGYYSVKLTITTDLDCVFEHVFVDWVKVYGPVANIEVCDAGTCRDREVSFRDISHSIAPIVRWEWNFGDGTISTEQNPTHTYVNTKNPQDRFYWVTLTVEDELGCTDVDSVKVRPTFPFPQFQTESEFECGGELVSFVFVDSLSEGVRPFNAIWEFSDGQTAGGLEPILSFVGSPTGIVYQGTLTLFDINGCENTITREFTVFSDSLAPDFEPNTLVSGVCPPLDVNFFDRSTIINPRIVNGVPNEIVDWEWDFGDGNILRGVQNPTYTYTEPGIFSVSLTVFDAFGCEETITFPDLIDLNGPIGTFTVSDTIGYPDLVVDVRGIPEDPVVGADYIYTWDFGQGDFLTGQEAQFTYINPGVYLLGLILDDGSCEYVLPNKQRIEVLPCPVLDIQDVTQCVNQGPVLLDVFDSLTHTLRLGRLNYEWRDEQGNVVSNDPQFEVPVPNNPAISTTLQFTIRIWIDDLVHGSPANSPIKCDQTASVTVNFEPSPTAVFDYNFTCNDLQNDPITVAFDASPSSGNGIDITRWLWDFNNDSIYGNNPNETPGNLDFEQETILFTFDSAGIYTVGLVVLRDDNSCADTVRRTVFIPKADFTIDNACAGQETTFNDASVFDPELGQPVYNWDFGDGTTSQEANPTHTFLNPGNFNVSLSLQIALPDGTPCQLVVNRQVSIFPSPEQVPIEVESACLSTGTLITYPVLNPAPSSIQTWLWDIGNNGTIDTVTQVNNIQWNFPQAGNFTVRAIAITGEGCQVENTIDFQVFPIPTANFEASNTCVGQETIFEDFTVIDQTLGTAIISWEFDFNGDGVFDQVFDNPNNIRFTYATAGDFSVTMRVTTNQGCSSQITKTIRVTPVPQANFTFENTCFGEQVRFLDQSTGFNTALVRYEWDFTNDGQIDATGTSPAFSFPAPGDYEVRLLVTNLAGCTDEEIRTVTVKPAPVVNAGDFVLICEGESATLTAQANTQVLFFQWDNNVGNTASVTVSPNQTTTYFVEVVDAEGCTGRDSVTVVVFRAPALPLIADACEGIPLVLDATVNEPGNYTVSYTWSNGATTPSIEVTENGVYSVNIRITGAGVSGSCQFTASSTVRFNPGPAPVEFGRPIFCSASPEPIFLTYPNANENLTVVWERPDGTQVVGASIEITVAGSYVATATNQFDCSRATPVEVEEICEPVIFVPTAFTPNNDGRNDTFFPKGRLLVNYEITIFNRWGEMIFQSTNPNEGWDGTFRGKKMPASLYPYVIVYENLENPGEKVSLTGTVALIR